ncbi:MAG: hypothetical protein RSC11_07090 [Mucinivorans sp.]
MSTKREIKEILCDELIGDIRSMIARMDSYLEYNAQITVDNDGLLANKAMQLQSQCNKLDYQISNNKQDDTNNYRPEGGGVR